ncbi:hypothetical protein [Nonomuraea africana]|uniref:hypothetical protein n=1 Tax=Nonomuraea africana TaxID=46171 RepID=UPI0033DE1726
MALTGDYEPSASGWVREHVEQIVRTGSTDGVTGLEQQPIGQSSRGPGSNEEFSKEVASDLR